MEPATRPADTWRYVAVAVPVTVALVGISALPDIPVAKYRWSFLSLVPALWIAFALRRPLLLTPGLYALFAGAILVHDLGAFGAYSWRVRGVPFDWPVHFLFGIVGGLIVARFLERRLALRGAGLLALTVLVVTGLGGLHEIVEAASTMFLGREHGMLVIGQDNPLDTQHDLLNNVLGATSACLLRGLSRRPRPS